MRVLRSLYGKIFGWFWLTLLAGACMVLALTVLTGDQPMGKRWMRVTQDLYAHSAVDFYESGGAPALQQYLARLQQSSGMQSALLDERQQNVLAQPLPPHVGAVQARAVATGKSSVQLGRIWCAATPVQFGARHFVFVIEVHPLRGFIDGTFALPAFGRIAVALLVAALFCFLLTRHIVAPVQALQAAAQRLAAGDLSTRALPSLGRRQDELAELAKAFDAMAGRVQLLVETRQELLADISHELRSPLTRMSVSLELLQRGETDVVAQMQADVERMNEMIAQILLLTRLDMQPLRASMEPVDVSAMLAAIARDADFEARHEGNRVSVTGEVDCHIHGDANLLRSCIENIVRNAVRHTAPGTGVAIAAYVTGEEHKRRICAIKVTDHGPGVPDKSLPYLCEPFFRVSEARTTEDGGTGLGLSISRRIAELHRGNVAIENVQGGGLRVTVSLPLG